MFYLTPKNKKSYCMRCFFVWYTFRDSCIMNISVRYKIIYTHATQKIASQLTLILYGTLMTIPPETTHARTQHTAPIEEPLQKHRLETVSNKPLET